MFEIQNIVIIMVVSLSLVQCVAGTCDTPEAPCAKMLNTFCCQRPDEVVQGDPGKKVCCEFPAFSLDKDCKNNASDSLCQQKKSDGYCTHGLVEYMKVYCRKTCGFCGAQKN